MSRVRAVLIGLLLAASVTQSLFFAWALVPDPEEEMYMYLGKLALTGRISLFQDELVGNRMPLPYYVMGFSQLLWPRSLLAARFFSAALGLVTLVLAWRIAARLRGQLAGILTLLFAATDSLLIGYFDAAYYHSLVSCLLLLSLYLYLGVEWRYRRLATMAVVALLFFTRTTVMPLIPLALVYLLWEARDRRERLALVAIALLPAAAFFASDVRHWKLLAYVPVLDHVAAWFGFASNRGAAFEVVNVVARESPVKTALVLFARWYRMWILVSLLVLACALADGGIRRRLVSNRGVTVVTAVLLYLMAWQVLIMGRWKLQLAVGYFPSFAILGAICLGCWVAAIIVAVESRPRIRTAALLILCAVVLVAPAQSRPPMLPLQVSWQDPPVTRLYRLAEGIGRTIPPGSHVFHLGGPLGLYIAGLEPYLRQERDVAALVLSPAEDVSAKSGLWGWKEIQQWLLRDAAYAVIVPSRVAAYRGTALEPGLALIDSLLAVHFRQAAVLDSYPGSVYYILRRVD